MGSARTLPAIPSTRCASSVGRRFRRRSTGSTPRPRAKAGASVGWPSAICWLASSACAIRSLTPTRRASCIATSNRPISCWASMARRWSIEAREMAHDAQRLSLKSSKESCCEAARGNSVLCDRPRLVHSSLFLTCYGRSWRMCAAFSRLGSRSDSQCDCAE